jgi:hypothetical protein
MVATPLLRQRLMDKENVGAGRASDGSPVPPRRALPFAQHNEAAAEAAPSPWQERAKALQRSVASTDTVSAEDAQRTRANVTKAREAIERWAKATAADERPPSAAPASPPSPYGVRCSPDVRVSAFLGFQPPVRKEPPEAGQQQQQQPLPAHGLALPAHPRIAAALEESAQQLRVCEERVQREEQKVSQLRQQLAQERQQRADRDQQWEALHGRCEQRIRVLEKLRRSEKADAEEEVRRRLQQLNDERRDEEELCGARLVSVCHRARRARVLQRCVVSWVQQCQPPGEARRLLSTVWRAWAHQALTGGMRAKLREQAEELAMQNQEYLTAVSNLKSAAQKKLEAALEAQRNELMQKHGKTLSMQQRDFDEQCEASGALLRSVTTSMHVRYCAGLLRAALGWLRELSARRRQLERVVSARAQLQSRRRCEGLFCAAFRSWARLALSAARVRFERLATGVALRRDRVRRRALFEVREKRTVTLHFTYGKLLRFAKTGSGQTCTGKEISKQKGTSHRRGSVTCSVIDGAISP